MFGRGASDTCGTRAPASSADETRLTGGPDFTLRHGRRSAESKRVLPEWVNAGGPRVALHGGVHSTGEDAKCGHSPLKGNPMVNTILGGGLTSARLHNDEQLAQACEPASEVEYLIARIEGAIRGVSEAAITVQSGADKLFGSSPNPSSAAASKGSAIPGLIGKAHAALDELENVIVTALGEARRLNRI